MIVKSLVTKKGEKSVMVKLSALEAETVAEVLKSAESRIVQQYGQLIAGKVVEITA